MLFEINHQIKLHSTKLHNLQYSK